MSSTATTARDLYLATLSPEDELIARRVAEKSGIPGNDPTWLLLTEVQRACREATRCTDGLTSAAKEAVARIERAGQIDIGEPNKIEGLGVGIAHAVGSRLADNEQLLKAISDGVRHVEIDAIRVIRSLETATRDLIARRSSVPIASILFAFCLGLAAATFGIWQAYRVALGYGQDIGYSAGFARAQADDRSHR
jgi:hypothetical protein